MRSPLLLALALLPLGEPARAQGAAAIVLADGRVLEGEDVRREGDLIVLELPTGEAIAVPDALVGRLRLGDGGPLPLSRKAPPGLRLAEPETLAGTFVPPPRREEQVAVFGEPARFNPGPIDVSWKPRSWFDPDRDVLARSRARWARSLLDPNWTPSDGFRRER